MQLSTTTQDVGLRINKVTREIYDYLRSSDLINDDELYCVENEFLDAEGHRAINVAAPISASDGTNKAYVDAANAVQDVLISRNSEDIRDRYAKSETYSQVQVNDTLRNLSAAYYTKGQVDSIISSHEIYRIRKIPQTGGSVFLYNMCTNIMHPESDLSLVFPEQIVGSELTRSFQVVLDGHLSSIDVAFVGQNQEILRFKGLRDSDELTSDGTYSMFFDEISSSVFQVGIRLLTDISSVQTVLEEYDGTNVYIMDAKINTYKLTSDTNFIFPMAISDDMGIRIPRVFELYLTQDTVSAYDFQFSGFDGEELKMKMGEGQQIKSMELSSEYAFLFNELSDEGSTFLLGQKKTVDVGFGEE